MSNGKYKVITMCGSTKFKEEFEKCIRQLTLEGNIVINISTFWRGESRELNDEVIKMFQDMHFARIDMADAIAVVNYDDYIGESTSKEIEYATEHGKEIIYMYPHTEKKHVDVGEIEALTGLKMLTPDELKKLIDNNCIVDLTLMYIDDNDKCYNVVKDNLSYINTHDLLADMASGKVIVCL